MIAAERRKSEEKLFAAILVISMLFGMTACDAADEAATPEDRAESHREENGFEGSGDQESLTVQNETALPEDTSGPAETAESNILIAYFTWADNTVVEDEEAALQSALSHYESVGDRTNYDEADAATSASVLAPGNTAQMAGWIQERTGGELFPIVVSESYPSNYDECLDRAADEKAEDVRPKLAEHVEHMEDYDIVFLGYPIWWGEAPRIVDTFVESYDFSEKTMIPFCTSGGSGIGSSADTLEELAGAGTWMEGKRFDGSESQEDMLNWFQGLGN